MAPRYRPWNDLIHSTFRYENKSRSGTILNINAVVMLADCRVISGGHDLKYEIEIGNKMDTSNL